MFIIFICEIVHTVVELKKLNPYFFIGAQMWTVQEMGMRMPWVIQEDMHIHRLILPSFLHFGFSHLVVNIILLMALGSLLESIMGALRMIIFFIIACIGPQIFAACASGNYALGSDPVIFAILGGMFSVMLVYWPRLGEDTCSKICPIFMLVFILIITILLMSGHSAMSARFTKAIYVAHPDIFGIIGGFLYGFSAAMFLLPIFDPVTKRYNKREIIIACVGLFIVVLITVVCAAVLFAGQKHKHYWYMDKKPEIKT